MQRAPSNLDPPKRLPNAKSDVIQTLDGPPVDYSFKNIRLLCELQSTLKQTSAKVEEVKDKTATTQQNTLDLEMSETAAEIKLNIIRTIDIMDSKMLEGTKSSNHKNSEKLERKEVRRVHSKTTALFLRYNKIISLDGLQKAIGRVYPLESPLMWLDLSHNRLTALTPQIGQLPYLKTLYLHVNYLNNFKEVEKLGGAKLLKIFTIHANPLQNYPQFRVLIASILPTLQKIDSTLLTRRERERGMVLLKAGQKYPIISNPQKPPQESENEDQS